jgi:hypothetical protein
VPTPEEAYALKHQAGFRALAWLVVVRPLPGQPVRAAVPLLKQARAHAGELADYVTTGGAQLSSGDAGAAAT